jgi:hypothetical protein
MRVVKSCCSEASEAKIKNYEQEISFRPWAPELFWDLFLENSFFTFFFVGAFSSVWAWRSFYPFGYPFLRCVRIFQLLFTIINFIDLHPHALPTVLSLARSTTEQSIILPLATSTPIADKILTNRACNVCLNPLPSSFSHHYIHFSSDLFFPGRIYSHILMIQSPLL